MIPSGRTVLLAAFGVALALAVAIFAPMFWPVWLAYWMGLLAAFVVDLVAAQRQRELVLESRPPAMIYIGNTEPWRLHFESERARRLELLADVDEEFDPVPVHEVALQEGETEVALALLEAGLAWARSRGTRRVEARVSSLNPAGQAFWRAAGFGDFMDVLHRRL